MKGRPTDYTDELADAICAQISEGTSLKDICLRDDMPARSTVYVWFRKIDGFMDMYVRAREERAELFADEIVRIADECEDPQKARVQIDARKWAAAKLNPKNYGDKIDLNHGGQKDNPIVGGEIIVTHRNSPTNS